MELIHASCIRLNGYGILICGPSGSGKSDLALRLIEQGARLVSDDYVYVQGTPEGLVATTPSNIAGLLEVRGVGLLSYPYRSTTQVMMVFEMVANKAIKRMPEQKTIVIDGVTVPCVDLYPFEASACAKVRAALHYVERM